ncbi:hypothetical protein BTHE68_71260 (plasmid) [Burkholderia sp. THE68]|nr:hypothetical protein BTHE68_71260 [Burkholderia sp. THE68]
MSTLEPAYQSPTPGPFSIVFVHGLNVFNLKEHPKTTWMSNPDDDATLWPVWIGEDSGCDTWVLGYDAALSRWHDDAMSLPDQGTNVLDRLSTKAELRDRPLILVGHSMGGLVIKTAIVHAMTRSVKREEELVKRIRGVVFMATPHQGSDLANVATFVRALRTNRQVGDITAHDAHLRTLNQQFLAQLNKLHFDVRTFFETKGLEVGKRLGKYLFGPRVMVVRPGSGDPHVPGEAPISIAANHLTICSPANRHGEQVHDSLLDFIRQCKVAAPSTHPAPPDQSGTIAELLKIAVPASLVGLPGQLSGHTDSRLRPREGIIVGRDGEIARVLAFLRSSDDSTVVCAHVTGAGGIGKTEICKAALKDWLKDSPAEVAFYVDVPDETSPAELPALIGRTLGFDDIAIFDQLAPLLKPGLYYLDNLESVAEKAEGVKLLRALQQRNGVRLLASSRVDLTGVMSKPIRIDVLPLEWAMHLFREVWAGTNQPSDSELHQYVSEDLGCHALSITLTARLGHSYSFDELVTRWRRIGVTFAKNGPADSRLDSLPISLKLTRDALSSQPGALPLWTLAALFPAGIDAQLVSFFQQTGGWSEEARQALSRHHVWQLREDQFHLLPPVARFALDEVTAEPQNGLWAEVRSCAFNFFIELASVANSIASTEKSLQARAQLLATFDALHRLIIQDLRLAPDTDKIKHLVSELGSLCQFSPVLSIEILHASLPLFEYERDELGQANTLQSLGDLESRLGRFDAARALYERALPLYERQRNELGQANTLRSLGDLERRLGQVDAARALYERALSLYERQRNELGQANTLQSLGELERRLGQIDAARALYERVLPLFERQRNELGQANTFWSLGELDLRLGQIDAARALYERALSLYERQRNELGQANTLQSLGDLERRLGQVDAARALYERALPLYERQREELGQANTLRSLGDLESLLGQLDAARALYERALPLYERQRQELGQANTLQSLGDLKRVVGAFDDALLAYHSALRWYAQQQDPMGQAYTYAEVARCNHALGQKHKQDVALKKALVTAQALHIESVMRYVIAALVEITGSEDAAQAWLNDSNDLNEGDIP